MKNQYETHVLDNNYASKRCLHAILVMLVASTTGGVAMDPMPDVVKKHMLLTNQLSNDDLAKEMKQKAILESDKLIVKILADHDESPSALEKLTKDDCEVFMLRSVEDWWLKYCIALKIDPSTFGNMTNNERKSERHKSLDPFVKTYHAILKHASGNMEQPVFMHWHSIRIKEIRAFAQTPTEKLPAPAPVQ